MTRGMKDTVTVPISKIVVDKRSRALDQAKVDALTESISAIGLQHPISVYQRGDEYHLVTGEHRLEAVKKLGWSTIGATKITDANRELWEIDENLMRAELSTDEKREHLKRRKSLWEKRQAEAKEVENSGASCAINRGRGRPKGFAAETSAVTGISKSHINKMVSEPKSKKPKAKLRRNFAEIERFLTYVSGLETQNDIDAPKLSDLTLNLLATEQKANAIEVIETAMARLGKKLDQLRPEGGSATNSALHKIASA
jgi:uncharacterized ParB-like nuclease family protein